MKLCSAEPKQQVLMRLSISLYLLLVTKYDIPYICVFSYSVFDKLTHNMHCYLYPITIFDIVCSFSCNRFHELTNISQIPPYIKAYPHFYRALFLHLKSSQGYLFVMKMQHQHTGLMHLTDEGVLLCNCTHAIFRLYYDEWIHNGRKSCNLHLFKFVKHFDMKFVQM